MSVMSRIEFRNRCIIVTGAGNGLGRTYAIELARRGASVVVNDAGVTPDGMGASTAAADAVVDEIRSAGGDAVASTESVATTAGVTAIRETALDQFGRIDGLINNAGILRDAAFEDISDDDFNALIDTHLRGAFGMTRAVLPVMKAARYGRVVFTSSGAGVFGRGWQASYSAAKSSMLGLSHAVAIEGARFGIRANAVLPVATTRLAGESRPPESADQDVILAKPEMAVMFQRSRPEFVTPLVVYLASEPCAVTQGVYSAVGGRYARVMLGVTAGWWSSGEEPPTPEAVADHWDTVEDTNEYDLPRSVMEEMYMTAVRASRGTQ
jgi:NAD(P)-dependent dehydrogenase (short-subunit alcohol dehydrogenase family)